MTTTGWRKALGAAAAAVLALALSACAPEPTGPVDDTLQETPTRTPEPEADLNTEVPESFPDGFVIPEGTVVHDVGEREPGDWFLVLEAESGTEAELWDRVIAENGFSVADEERYDDGEIFATLTSEALEITALLVMQSDGSGLLSYDIEGR